MTFPASPSDGQLYSSGLGTGYKYSSDKTAWMMNDYHISGATGIQGDIGLQGYTGIQGATGLWGATGIQGFSSGASTDTTSDGESILFTDSLFVDQTCSPLSYAAGLKTSGEDMTTSTDWYQKTFSSNVSDDDNWDSDSNKLTLSDASGEGVYLLQCAASHNAGAASAGTPIHIKITVDGTDVAMGSTVTNDVYPSGGDDHFYIANGCSTTRYLNKDEVIKLWTKADSMGAKTPRNRVTYLSVVRIGL